MIAAPSTAGVGENSSDECCVCGDSWTEGQTGWILCDAPQGCDSTVCKKCTASLSLSVGELFYCPLCAGSGQSAAAAVGGAVAAAVIACTELEKLPLSFATTTKILTNLRDKPDEPKYRKLRLENKSVKELVDLEPVLNILTSVGFARTNVARQTKRSNDSNANLPPTEEVLLLEGPVPKDTVKELLDILNGLSKGKGDDEDTDGDANGKAREPTAGKKREANEPSEESEANKKPKAE